MPLRAAVRGTPGYAPVAVDASSAVAVGASSAVAGKGKAASVASTTDLEDSEPALHCAGTIWCPRQE